MLGQKNGTRLKVTGIASSATCLFFFLGMALPVWTAAAGKKTKAGKKKKAPPIKPVTLKGNLTSADPLDWQRRSSYHKVHNVKMKAGQMYSVSMSASFPPYVRIEDALGNQRAIANRRVGNTASVQFTPEKTGAYRIIATSASSRRTGAYSLAVRASRPVLALRDKLTRRDPFDRVRTRHHRKVHKLKMAPGKTYTIHLKSEGHDGYLRLEDSQKRQISSNDDWMNTRNSRIVFNPTKADTYRIIVTTFSSGATGSYTLTVTD